MGKTRKEKSSNKQQDDDEMHVNMLAQLGLKVDSKEGKEIL